MTRVGVEPTTPGLKGQRSAGLSYRATFNQCSNLRLLKIDFGRREQMTAAKLTTFPYYIVHIFQNLTLFCDRVDQLMYPSDEFYQFSIKVR